ncbi:hypothetical protein [Virgisporangium aurantiacum]|uniref:Uncharacterized protein n=1 Tax=Virgisporangium aurantiacum TaxID=175570 RepID=A0A8J4E7E1_9ACTN|nr:hypothetical protein [Virgisporangium aurantiacum]GIJ64108.1 hypothetical protein Vau01_116240 [Virgisporangium aurantiacum]
MAVIVAVIVAAILVAGTVRPAGADGDEGNAGRLTIRTTVALEARLPVMQVIEIAGFVLEVIGAFRTSGEAVIQEVDSERVTDARGKLRNIGSRTVDMRDPSSTVRYLYLRDARDAASYAHTEIERPATVDQKQIDHLTRISMAAYDLTLAATSSYHRADLDALHESLGHTLDDFLDMLDSATTKLMATTSCRQADVGPSPGVSAEWAVICHSYNAEDAWAERTTTAGERQIKRGFGAEWEPGSMPSNWDDIKKMALRDTVLYDAYQAQINLLATKAKLQRQP